MKIKSKRNFWTNNEIDCMLNLIKEVRLSHGSTATTHYTFVQLQNKMKKRGFPNKSPTQIRRKWFQMKSAYLCFKRGNVERLLLIPEKFRAVIAEFVEADCKQIQVTDEEPRIRNDIIAPNEPVIVNEPLAKIEPTTVKELIVRDEPIARKEQTTKKESSTRKETIVKKQPLVQQPLLVIKETPAKTNQQKQNDYLQANNADTYYDRKFSKLLGHIRHTHSFISAEFQKKQEELMSFEQSCQMIRDSQLIKFMENIAFKSM